MGAYTSPTLNLRPKELHLRAGTVYEFEVIVRAGGGNVGDANTRLGSGLRLTLRLRLRLTLTGYDYNKLARAVQSISRVHI